MSSHATKGQTLCNYLNHSNYRAIFFYPKVKVQPNDYPNFDILKSADKPTAQVIE